jgi:hypothetical protein
MYIVAPNPNSGRMGNLPTLTGTLYGLSRSGLVYLKRITDKLIIAKVTTTAKTTMFATITISK